MVINLFAVAGLLGRALTALAVFALVPAAYSVLEGSTDFWAFALTAFTAFVISGILKFIGRKHGNSLTIRELFLFTASLWLIAMLITAIPIYLLLEDINYFAACFETSSAMSTTGATAIPHLDIRSPAVLLWRSLLQLLGGIGFVMVAVAILPQMAMGGMNIFKTESTSFENSSKFTPHAKTMAMVILAWYIGNLVLCTAAYIIGGMSFFMAFNAACCTVATGGMMPIDSSMNNFSPFVHYSASFFMFVMSCPFMVFIAAMSVSPMRLFHDQQVRQYFAFTLVIVLIISATLCYYNNYDYEKAFRVSLFNVTSILSTSGFALEDFTQWNHVATLIFLIILPLGGCSGSTAGGIKFFRLSVCASLFKTQIVKTIHPHRVINPQFNSHDLSQATVSSIITFITAYVLMVILSSLAATMLGLNIIDAISASMTCISNIGPAMGPQLNPNSNFAGLNDGLYILFSLDMLTGRLEIIPVCLILTRMFWR